jgi:dethiobiotin synthetase
VSVLVLTGTGTGVGKTVAAAAVAALALSARHKVAVLKPAQTGVADDEPGDVDEVARLAGNLTRRELARYPDPLAPATAARVSGRKPVRPADVAQVAVELDRSHDLVIIEGAGGLLVRFDDDGGTLADVAWAIGAPVVIVVEAGLGTLNSTALTAEALQRRGISCAGLVIGEWTGAGDLATLHNLEDLPAVANAPLLGVLPRGMAELSRVPFRDAAQRWLAPRLGGAFNADAFVSLQFGSNLANG